MNINARIHGRKIAQQKRLEAKESDELRQHLKAATKALKGRRPPLEIDDLSLPKQVSLLEAYALYLQDELDDFAATWGSDGSWGVRRLQTEIKSVLDHVARLIVRIGKGEKDG